MQFLSIGSGSSGNAYYVCEGDYALLIDAGIPLRRFKKFFVQYGLSYGRVKGILITHDHADHVRAVGALSMQYEWPVYALDDVYMGINRNRFVRKKVPARLAHSISLNAPFQLGPFTIKAFPIPHDSAACCGYTLECGATTFCLATDVGQPTMTLVDEVRRATHLVIEANYDARLLETGPYPMRLKNRIRSGTGHLENTQTALLLAQYLNPAARNVWLCHLSEENNRPDVALDAVRNALRQSGRLTLSDPLQVEALQRTVPSRLFEL